MPARSSDCCTHARLANGVRDRADILSVTRLMSRDAESWAEERELVSGSELLVRFSVTAALRHLFALVRHFRFEGFGIRAAIHANPDLLSNVRALGIVCAIHAPHCSLRPRLRGAQFSFLLLFPSDSTPLFNIRHATQKPRRKQRNRWMWILESANLSMHRILLPIRAKRCDEDHTSPGTRMPTTLLDIDRCQGR
jgi:hypothetical protein